MIRKAVLPVAGFGTRFLPASKATPKEMLPIIDKPLVQYAVEEAIDSGINEIIFITSPEKHSIKKHFKTNKDLELRLKNSNKEENFVLNTTTKNFSCVNSNRYQQLILIFFHLDESFLVMLDQFHQYHPLLFPVFGQSI